MPGILDTLSGNATQVLNAGTEAIVNRLLPKPAAALPPPSIPATVDNVSRVPVAAENGTFIFTSGTLLLLAAIAAGAYLVFRKG